MEELSSMINTRQSKFGEKSSHWKGGKPRCEICGKKLPTYGAKRCTTHEAMRRKKPTNHCIDCSIEIKRNVKRCLKCYRKQLLVQNKTMKRSDLVQHHIFGKTFKDTIRLTNSLHKKLHSNAYFYILERYGKTAVLEYIKWFLHKERKHKAK
jgi:hypothetical protein